LLSLDLTPPVWCTVVEDHRLALFGLVRLLLPGVPLLEIIGLLSFDSLCSLWTCETPSAGCTIVGDRRLALFGFVRLLLPDVPVRVILQVTVNVLVLFQVKSGSANQDDADMLGFVMLL